MRPRKVLMLLLLLRLHIMRAGSSVLRHMIHWVLGFCVTILMDIAAAAMHLYSRRTVVLLHCPTSGIVRLLWHLSLSSGYKGLSKDAAQYN